MSRIGRGKRQTAEAQRVFRMAGGRPVSASVPPDGQPAAVPQAVEVAQAVTEEDVRRLAYRKWEEAGRPPGDGAEYWRAAEWELAGR